MTGHHPWETLLEGLTPERRKAIAAGAAKIRADIDRREAQEPLDAQRPTPLDTTRSAPRPQSARAPELPVAPRATGQRRAR